MEVVVLVLGASAAAVATGPGPLPAFLMGSKAEGRRWSRAAAPRSRSDSARESFC
ncbi:MAG TPA: hypothetical protein VKC65_08755 [Gaiellaceae bacterium]|nr:hypothetical protein [Gaiellaceae bacterium]